MRRILTSLLILALAACGGTDDSDALDADENTAVSSNEGALTAELTDEADAASAATSEAVAATAATLEDVRQAEAALDGEALVEAALRETVEERFSFPALAPAPA